MTTIMVPQELNNAIRSMNIKTQHETVNQIANKHGYDSDWVAETIKSLSIEDDKSASKRGSKSKDIKEKSTDKPKVKRPKNGYNLYCDEIRAQVKEELQKELGEGEKLGLGPVSKVLGERWKAESNETRDKWNLRAKTESGDNSE
jgi:hypothetical protein